MRNQYKQIWWGMVLMMICMAVPASAQSSFSSGSTGADGAFAPPSSPSTQNVQVPPSGVFNFTTVNIPSGVTIKFIPNAANTPVTILATGDVTIAGIISVDGKGMSGPLPGIPGPGGFKGGRGGYGPDNLPGTAGDGPGGGGGGKTTGTTIGYGGGGGYSLPGGDATAPNGGQGGARYGSSLLLPLIGGSGGGGASATGNGMGNGGGGGGGAILIASSTAIRIMLGGNISAVGGQGTSGAGPGSGGAIRLVSNMITCAGLVTVAAGATGIASASPGYIRVEAYDLSQFTVPTGAVISFGPPNPIVLPTNAPKLRIVSIAGVNAPTTPAGSFQAPPDVVIPTTQTSPVTVALEANNIPVGTLIQVSVIPEQGSRTGVESTALAGNEALSTATASVTLPSGVSVLVASATVPLLTANGVPFLIDGEQVDRVEVTATYGSESSLTYITKSGKRIAGIR